MTEWREVTLGELCKEGGGFIRTGPFGSQLHQHDYINDPAAVAVVMPKDMAGGRVDFESAARISDETSSRLSAHILQPGDVVLARRGDVGRFAWISDMDPPTLCGTGSMRVHLGKENTLAPRFLRYLMEAPAVGDYLRGQAVGATMPNLNAAIVESLPVLVPPTRVQGTIVSVLGSIDDMIENNRRRVEVLEATVRAIYREWFVDFRYPGHEHTRLVDSPLGPIPEGWTVEELRGIAALERTTVQPGRFPDEEFDHYSIPAFDDGQIPTIDRGGMVKSGKFAVTSKAVLVSKLNPRIQRVWFVEPTSARRSISSTEFLILRPAAGGSLEYLYLLTRSTSFQDRLLELSGGTSTSHQRAKPDDFMAIPVVSPADRVVAQFSEAVAPMLRLARTLITEGQNLASLRDLLLPKLVTGHIDVSALDLDGLVEATSA